MLSNMASKGGSVPESGPSDTHSTLDELARAEVLAHTRYPILGAWYPFVGGSAVGLWLTSFAIRDLFGFPLRILVTIGVLAGLGAYNRKRRTMPRLSSSPAEIKSVMVKYLIGLAVFAAVVFGLWQMTKWWIVALGAAVEAAVLLAVYERAFDEAARRAERAAGISDAEIAEAHPAR